MKRLPSGNLFFSCSMKLKTHSVLSALLAILLSSCVKTTVEPKPPEFSVAELTVNGKPSSPAPHDIPLNPPIRIRFTRPVDTASARQNIALVNFAGSIPVPSSFLFENKDSVVVLSPQSNLSGVAKYFVSLSSAVVSADKVNLQNGSNYYFITRLDSADKFPRITDAQLLDSVERRTLAYFWEFGHPVSGMARERNSSGDIVTTGGTGFGIMAMVAGASRGFITRSEARARITKITDFLTTKCTRYHGAFSHWINGSTGATVPFSTNDNGGDLVETSYLVSGLLTARQYFNGADAAEGALRDTINSIWNRVEWNWYRQNNQDLLYWHWSADKGWIMNMGVQGWNEALIVYALAASSNTDTIPVSTYQKGWARNGGIRNGGSYYGYTLPLGPANGGPLFWAQYSFLGINPNGLTDSYADYQLQVTNHTKINRAYCIANPRGHYGYSNLCWGLTASDIPNGYNANEPNNDPGVITPSAAISSMPYTPQESMEALRFFYYTMGDKLWKNYGFVDAFSLDELWYANSYLAIDEGPIVVMIENYRTGLIWDLFMSCPEIKRGMKRIGFQGPHL
jgi:hypothetical protein